MNRTPRSLRISRSSNAVAVVVCAVSIYVVFEVLSLKAITFLVSDDAYYYFQVGKNIAGGLGSTFNGVDRTNGYHPLWMLMVIPIFKISTFTPEYALRFLIGSQTVLGLMGFWLCACYLRRTSDTIGVATGLVVLMMLASPLAILLNGLETALLLLLLFLTLLLDSQFGLLDETANLQKRLTLGLLLGAIVLSRLDAAMLVVGLAIWKLFGRRVEQSIVSRVFFLLRFYAPTILAFALLVAPYFVWNYSNFGHVMPISGAIKTSFPIPRIPNTVKPEVLPYVVPFLASCVWVVYSKLSKDGLLHRKVSSSERREANYDFLYPLSTGCLVHLLWTAFFMRWGVYQWHFAMYIPTLTILSARAAQRLVAATHPNKVVAVLAMISLAVCLVSFTSLIIANKGRHHAARYEAALWAQETTAPGTMFALKDAGMFAFFSERPTVNLDGVINSYAFQESIKNGDLANFLADRRVQYVADAFAPCDRRRHRFRILAYRGRTTENPVGYRMTLPAEEMVFLSEPRLFRPLTANREICFGIWNAGGVVLDRL